MIGFIGAGVAAVTLSLSALAAQCGTPRPAPQRTGEGVVRAVTNQPSVATSSVTYKDSGTGEIRVATVTFATFQQCKAVFAVAPTKTYYRPGQCFAIGGH